MKIYLEVKLKEFIVLLISSFLIFKTGSNCYTVNDYFGQRFNSPEKRTLELEFGSFLISLKNASI